MTATRIKLINPVLMVPLRFVGSKVSPLESRQSPLPFAIAMELTLLTMFPICTAMDTEQPLMPSGMVNVIASQAAMPCGIG